MAKPMLARRAVLVLGSLLTLLGARAQADHRIEPHPDAAARQLLAVLKAPQSARHIGQRALSHDPALADPAELVRQLQAQGLTAGDLNTRRQRLNRVIRDDFAHGRTVVLEGWLLARTEVRLCALAAQV